MPVTRTGANNPNLQALIALAKKSPAKAQSELADAAASLRAAGDVDGAKAVEGVLDGDGPLVDRLTQGWQQIGGPLTSDASGFKALQGRASGTGTGMGWAASPSAGNGKTKTWTPGAAGAGTVASTGPKPAAPTLIAPPPFPTAEQLKSKTEPGAAMPAEAVTYVKKMMMGDMHARWHTTRDFKFTMAELPASAPASSPTGKLNAAWNALRAAGQGVPAPKPKAGAPPLTPEQQTFVSAMNAFVTANAKSKEGATSDVVQGWQQIQKQNWPIPAREEGDPGNGLDFLAMHHDMVTGMKKHCAQDPVAMAALNGWAQLPTPKPWPYDPKDSTAGVAKATTAVNLLNEMTTASDPASVTKFKTDFKQVTGLDFDQTSPDQFGAWIQSSAAGLPNSGIHNWMHNEYEVPGSPIEMDSFNQNVQNQHFWGLHGFIENSFMKFLSLRNIPVSSLQSAFDEQNKEMDMGPMPMGMPKGAAEPDPGLQAVIHKAEVGMIDRGRMQ